MKLRSVPLLILACASAHAADENRAAPVDTATLMADLDNESYPVRVTATHELWSRGKKVLPLLEKAAVADSPESSARARDLVRKIRLGLTPESKPEWIGYIEAYDAASPRERREIVSTLKRDEAYMLLLRLYEFETDEATLAVLAPEMEGVAVAAARELLFKGDVKPERILEVLELGRPEPAQWMALADFHRVHGSLEKELKEARADRTPDGFLWRACLHAAAGRPLEAAREADAGGFPDAVARWRLLGGDPVPWILRAEAPQHEIVPESLEAYRDAVRGLWEGRPVPNALVDELAGTVSGAMDDESWHSVAVLYALGAREEGDEGFRKISPTAAFNHFDSSERIDEALQLLGLDPAEPDFAAWIRPRFDRMLREADDAEVAREELKTLGGFMERRGLVEEAAALFVPPLLEIAAKDPEWFCDLLADFFLSDSIDHQDRLTEAVLQAGAAFAGGDQGRLSMVRASLLGEELLSSELWSQLEREQGDRPAVDRLRLAATLLGKLSDSSGEADQWWAAQLADQPKKGDRTDELRWALLLRLAGGDSNAARFLEIEDILEKTGVSLDPVDALLEDIQLEAVRLQNLELAGRWSEVLAEYRKHFESTPRSAPRLAAMAAVSRLAGDPDEAARLEKRMEAIILGDTSLMIQVSRVYAGKGDHARSREWIRRAAMMSTKSDEVFLLCCNDVGNEAKYTEDWPLAASLGEVIMLSAVMRGDTAFDDPSVLLRGRASIELCRALADIEAGRRDEGMAYLERWRDAVYDAPEMADHYFAAFRKAGLTAMHDAWFEATWKRLSGVLADYPRSANTLNTAAWVAGRASRRLKEAHDCATRALAIEPHQWSYLDTMAEVWFARRDRAQAIEWGDRARNHFFGQTASLTEMLRQNRRFHRGGFPPP